MMSSSSLQIKQRAIHTLPSASLSVFLWRVFLDKHLECSTGRSAPRVCVRGERFQGKEHRLKSHLTHLWKVPAPNCFLGWFFLCAHQERVGRICDSSARFSLRNHKFFPPREQKFMVLRLKWFKTAKKVTKRDFYKTFLGFKIISWVNFAFLAIDNILEARLWMF